MDITQAIQAIQVIWRNVEGIRPDAAPNDPSDKAEPLPRVLTYEATSETDVSQMHGDTWAPQTGTIHSDLMLPRTELGASTARARAMVKEFLLAMKANPNLSGTLMITSPIRARYMSWDFGGTTVIGYRIEIEYEGELVD